MSKPYVVSGGDRAGPVDHSEHDTFAEALEAMRAARSRDLALSIYNADRCDYCSIEGWDDGLTEDEREMLP